MYDRKTWIVVIACSILLAVNLYVTNKNAAAARQQQAQEAAARPAEPADEEPGVLKEVDPQPSEARQTYELASSEAKFTFSSLGGSLMSAELLDYPAVKDAGHMVTLNGGGSYGIGTICQGADAFEHVNYALLEDQSETGRKLVFGARHPSGLLVRKTWELVAAEPGANATEEEREESAGAPFLLSFTLEVKNPDDAQAQVALESLSLYLGRAQPLQKGENRINPATLTWLDGSEVEKIKSGSFRGGMFGSAKSLISKSVDELEFASVSSQFFSTVLKPAEAYTANVWAKTAEVEVPDVEEKELAIRGGVTLPSAGLAPGQGKTVSYTVFTGPKDNRMLRRMGGDWGEVMDYGWPIFRWPARFMNFLLVHVHDLVSKVSDKWSWGFAVILVTILVRALMWPLYARSNRTMKRMSKLKPEMDKLKEKYPDDPAKQQQEIMMLYRKFGINPVGGCLPMFAQIPIFFGFFRMLQHAVEMRGHGFLWVDDLSMPDTIAVVAGIPINILPIVMGLTSFWQMHLMPTTGGDKTQQMVMKFMPIMFLFFCYNYASALALYWTTSNLFSIVQTWITQRMPEPELKEKPGRKGGKSFMERMAAAAEEAQKQQKLKQAKGRVVDPGSDKPSKPRGPRTGG